MERLLDVPLRSQLLVTASNPPERTQPTWLPDGLGDEWPRRPGGARHRCCTR